MFLVTSLYACTGGNSASNAATAKYYVGTQGIVTRYDSFPSKLYYYGSQDSASNKFTFTVAVENQGASYSRGGVYVSGFDPSMFKFDEFTVPKDPPGACSLSIGSLGWGELGGIFRCDGFKVASDGSHTTVDIKSLKNFINGIGQRFDGTNWWDGNKFDMGVQFDGGQNDKFTLNFNGMGANVDYYQHGRLFIAVLSSIDYILNGGREFLLAGSTYEYPGGEKEYLTYNGQIVSWQPGVDQTTQHFLLTSCYQYTTFADPFVCVDPYPESGGRKVCTPKSITWNGGNGAPVAVTSIEQENTARKILFHINVKNIGTGQVYDPGRLEKCSPYHLPAPTADDLNVVYLGDVRIGGTGLRSTINTNGAITCNPMTIRLDPKTKTGSTTCTYPLEYTTITSAYSTPLVVELWYGYSQTVQKDIIVKRVV